MKVIELRAENLKRIIAVAIKPTGELVEIAGANGAGKTSVLDAIWWALGGERNVQAEPVRRGEQEASVVLDLGELKVTRKWRHGGQACSLTVENAEGMTAKSPQALLDSLVGELTFDPLEFARMKPAAQRDMLLEIAGLAEDMESFAVERMQLYNQRTAVNRLADQMKATLASEGAIIAEGEEVSLTKLAEELSAAERELRENNAFCDALERRKRERNGLSEQVAALEDKIKLLDRKIAADIKAAASLVDPDVRSLQKQLGTAEANNALVRAAKAQAAKRMSLDDQVGKSERLTEQLADLDARKDSAVRAALMPVPKLVFSDAGVLYDSMPFDQCSGAEQLRVSVAIGMALNPKLRILRITDGSLLDANNLSLLEAMAREHDFQVWIERVEPGRAGAVVIEDGLVASPFMGETNGA